MPVAAGWLQWRTHVRMPPASLALTVVDLVVDGLGRAMEAWLGDEVCLCLLHCPLLVSFD